MMTMSRAISAGQALDYYKQEFTNSKTITTANQARLRAVGMATWLTNGTLKARSQASNTSA